LKIRQQKDDAMEHSSKTYLPAAGHDWGLPLYDPLTKLLGTDKARRTLLDQAALGSTDRVLDIGCGTGTFLVILKRRYPSAQAMGIDPDPKALARAKKKANKAGIDIGFDEGFANELPYPAFSFDRVFSSFMFHHLKPDDREPTFREVRRVLKPGGSFHLVDFLGREASHRGWLSSLIHSRHQLAGNSPSQILALMNNAGLVNLQKLADSVLFLGQLRIAYYQAASPTA
jgi:ubiquinone/menaquinone biosynthesis C-methylase UbiE